MHSIAILITSRNNYEFMAEFWAKRINNATYPVLNIDEDSSPKQKTLGKQVCKNHNFTYMDREQRGLHNNVASAIKFFGNQVKYIIWFQTDCWPLQDHFFPYIENLVDTKQLEQFGTVGFNGIASDVLRKKYAVIMKAFQENKSPTGVVARSPASPGDNWQGGIANRKIKSPIDGKLFQKPFAVEITAWFAIAVNTAKFSEHIDTSHPFHFFHCWDDVSYQFLERNIYNLVLPNLYIDHRPDLKSQFKIPSRSVKLAYKNKDTYHSLLGFTEWKKVWGFDFDDRTTYPAVADRYKGTLVDAFYHHDPQNGPLRTFDVG